MSTQSKTVYLITGANRGIGILRGCLFLYLRTDQIKITGLALVSRIASKHPDAFIYAGVRDTSETSSLLELAARYPGRIVPIKCVAYDEEANAKLAREIYLRHGRLDTIIANAGEC